MRRLPSALAALALAASAGAGAAPAPDKGGFTLLHPTPTALLRELTTDRPDTTESPITVDAGHFQLEMSFVDYSRSRRRGGGRAEGTALFPFLLKVGVTNRVDFQIGFDPYVIGHESEPGERSSNSHGVGDTTLRVKFNLWGNDGPEPGFGKTSLGLMPFLKVPTAARDIGNGKVEGGLIVPFGVELPAGFSLSLMAEGDLVRDAANRRYGFEFVHTASLGRPLFSGLRGYVEYVGIAPQRTGSGYRALFSTGLTYALGKNAQLDAGVRVGLSRSADDFNAFAGISFRY